MGFKMKGAPYTSGGPKNMQNVLAGKDPAQVPAKRKGAKNYGQEAETQGPLAMDPNYNGEPGVQKEDFKQFSSKGPKAHKEGHKSLAITASESRKNFKTNQYRKGIGRIKEGGDSRKDKISTRTGRDKVVGSAGNKLVRSKRGSSKTVVVEKSVNKLTPKKQITKKIDKKNITKDLKSKGAKMHKKGHNEKIGPGGESKSKKTTVITQKGGPSKPGKKPGTTRMERVGEKIDNYMKRKSNKSKTKKFDPTKKPLKY